MKKWLAVVMVCLLVFGMSACSSSNEKTSGEGVTLNALFMKQAGYSEEDVKNITKEFEDKNPGIKVNPTFVPYESLEQKIQTSAKSGGYDVVIVDAPWTAKFAQAGFVKDVSDKISDDVKSEVFQGALDSVSYDGKNYGMPWLNDTKYLFYNKEMLKKAGFENPPETWEELMEQAKVIKDKGIVEYPIVWSWSQAEALVCDVTALVGSFGGSLVDDNGKPTVTSSENEKAVNFMVDSLSDGISNPESTQYLEEDVRGVFSSGKAAFALNWTYMFNMANDEKESSIAGQVGISPVPGANQSTGKSVNGGMGLSVTSGSKHDEEAWKYIEYLSSKEVQKNYAKNALPIWKSLYKDEEVVKTGPEVVEASKTQYENLVNRPRVPWYGEFSNVIQVELQKALLGSEKTFEALSNIQNKAKEITN
ncbi:extracellular solute-binding protein [Bacillus sp. SG-1]|uniref:extracellular solute-binding protein n=1 Tax=Bacillus sp. SG-1 TaxID=161544 RepID=UPI000154379B|nr:extracellular solute-binding protein [Bacillus sp. SG-1]EDL66555.1 putative sugar uptake ABC transporter periplasmic solute-binding protein precursor [Bacillus sp. SG-1]